MRIVLCILCLTSISLFAIDKNQIAATVNGKKISREEFEQSYKENQLFVGPVLATPKKVLDDLINRELGIAKAKKNNLDKNPIVKKKMEDVMYHAQISKDLEPSFKKIRVRDLDLKKYYAEFPEYQTSHILLRLRANPSESEKKAALKHILKIYEDVKKNPERFEELAKEYSQGSTASQGGSVGFQPAIKYAPEYFRAIKGKKKGHITSPVRSQFGFHIIKVSGVKEFKKINQALYKKIVYDKKRDRLIAEYFKKLRKAAKISINKNVLL